MQNIGVGVIGYGLAGAVFHVPLIQSVPRLALRKVSTSRTAEADRAGLTPVADASAVVGDSSIDLIVIASPNHTHYSLARDALLAGKHVVVDKPLATSLDEADFLMALAAERQRMLTVFHNRRWDGDFLTVRKMLEEGRLGDVVLYEACWDRLRPTVSRHWKEEVGPGGGALSDLGPHLIDQVLCLFGWPETLTADLAGQRPGAAVDDYFDLRLTYGEKRVRLSASNLAVSPRPRFQLHGTGGSFVKYGLDPQQEHLKARMGTSETGYGQDREERFGTLTDTSGASCRVPTEPGCYVRFYEAVADAILSGGRVPVPPVDARQGWQLIEAARQSAREGRTLRIALD